MYQGGNSEDPTAVISFEDIKDEKIRHLLAENDIESENQKDITEWFYKNNGAEYKRHGTAYPITLFKSEHGSERQWVGNYEIFLINGKDSSKIIPSYPENMPLLPIDAKYALSGIMNMIPQSEEVQHRRIVVEIGEKALESSDTMKFAASLVAVQSLPADMPEKERYVLFKQKSKEEMERMKDRDLIDFSYSKKSIEARDLLERCQNIGNLKEDYGEILYTDSEWNNWYFDKIVVESICGRNYFLEAIPTRLEKK